MDTNLNISCLRQLLDEDSSRLISGEVELKNSLSDWMSKNGSLQLKNLMHQYLEKSNDIFSIWRFFAVKNNSIPLSVVTASFRL